MIPLPDALLQTSLNRIEILGLPKEQSRKKITLAVYQNHSFELVASVLKVFLNYSGLEANFWSSDYDDSLSFNLIPKADLHLVWLDQSRYLEQENFQNWLNSRLAILKDRGAENILVACLARNDASLNNVQAVCVNLHTELEPLIPNYRDERLTAFSGTPLSNAACLEVARLLGLRYIPPFFFSWIS